MTLQTRIIIVLAVIILLGAFYEGYKYKPQGMGKVLSNSIFKADKGIVVKTPTGTRAVNPPRTSTVVKVDNKGKITEDRPWVTLCALPMLGIESGRAIKPRLAVQFLRSEVLDLGVSLGMSTDTISVSLDKDVRTWVPSLQNTSIGVGYGIDNAGYTRFLAIISVYL